MMWDIIATPIIKTIGEIVDQAVEDKDLALKIKSDIQMRLLDSKDKEIEAAAKVIVAEAQGESWLQRNWRPLLMLVIVAIVANNYLLFPYLSLFTDHSLLLELPAELFNLMTVGVGGYIVGRSAEKTMRTWKSDE